MSTKELLTGSGGILLVILTLLQITPIQINPWSWLATARTINGVSFDGSSNIKLYAGMSWTVGSDSASSGG